MPAKKIVICDHDVDRAFAIEKNMLAALRAAKRSVLVSIECEAPRLARMNAEGRFPVLDIDGEVWSLTPGKVFSFDDCARLLALLRDRA